MIWFVLFFTTRIQQEQVYTTQEIQHIIQYSYKTNKFTQHVYTTCKSKIKRIGPTHEGARIKQDPFCFQFALRLPNHNFEFQKPGKRKVRERQFVVNSCKKACRTGQQGSRSSGFIAGPTRLRKMLASSETRFALSLKKWK